MQVRLTCCLQRESHFADRQIFTLAKVAGLLVIICSAFQWGGRAAAPADRFAGGFSLTSFAVALIASLPADAGWVQLKSLVAGEIRNPQRNVLFALALGSITCIAIYVL